LPVLIVRFLFIYLKAWGYDPVRLSRQPPAVRFQARHSNELWQFDLSSSDLKQVKKPRLHRRGPRNSATDAIQRRR
jgi:hypothetical protein